MPLWMVPDQHITNDHLFSSWNTERPFKMKAHRMCAKVIADNYVKVLWLLIFYQKTMHIYHTHHSTIILSWKNDSIQLGTGKGSNQIVKQGIYLGCFWNTFDCQKLTNWKFVVRTQHGKSRMEENTNKMTAGWKVKGRQRILFVSTS